MQSIPAGPVAGIGQKFVRVTGTREPDLIEFDFAIGDPSLRVELLLPKAAFDEFCRTQRVRFLDARDAASETSDWDWDWDLRQARTQFFR